MKQTLPKKQKQKINGWLILDKPAGLSSTQALGRVKWELNAEKAGHGGTLDPFATGVLPIALGEATKLVNHVLDGKKSYAFTAVWGQARDTDDCTGKTIATSDARPTPEAITAALQKFTGTFQQMPPQFSALHVNGERAYDLARAGETVELQTREVTLTRFDYVGSPDAHSADFIVECSKGTYIRSLARDLGQVLGCYGHVKTLKRLSCGPFTMAGAISLETIEKIGQKEGGLERFQAVLLPLATVLDDIPALAVNEVETRRLRQGQHVIVHPLRITALMQSTDIIMVKHGEDCVALAKVDGHIVHPVRVFHLS
ncbi:MAG: tRNA pseudouridine(55) synthase TruB [Alphaproteobacteria bacterium]|nr:tRNA pseudouridine(55) synthase TruB [Alphaproteobacteria bacterium]